MKLEELKRLALDASHGVHDVHECKRYGCSALTVNILPYSLPVDRSFYSAVTPETVLKLIAFVELVKDSIYCGCGECDGCKIIKAADDL